jgi:nucleotide-binding universal stress UspA family protein
MDAINKILVPTDFSDTAQNAFRYALMLADKFEADIELLHVIYPEYEALDLPVMAAQATKEKAAAAGEVIKEFVELGLTQLHATGQLSGIPTIKSDVEIGTPASLIADVARRDEVELIVMGTRGTHNALDRFWGSVTTAVVEHAHCHVWVVPEHAPYSDINVAGFATNLGDADPYHIWEYGKLLAPFRPVLRCAHVNLDNSLDSTLDIAGLSRFFDNHAPSLQISFHSLEGETVIDGLETFIESFEIDVLAMYAPQHTWWERLFRRSETKNMALHSKIPLLMLKH